MKNNNYITPDFEVVEIAVERGFEYSATGINGPEFGEETVAW